MANELNVQLKARNDPDQTIYNLYPRTYAENVIESFNKKFVNIEQIQKWDEVVENYKECSVEDITNMFTNQ